jgi:hypothetical protein
MTISIRPNDTGHKKNAHHNGTQKMTLSTITFSTRTLRFMTFSTTILGIMILSILALSITIVNKNHST